MSKSVDSRVVEMVFDNKQFEAGIQTSLKSLESLNKTLGESGNMNALTSLQQGVEGLTNRFSTMGIIGMTALQEVTRSVLRTTSNVASGLLSLISQGGKKRALNIEQAKFQFKGLGMDIEAAMDDALYAVKGTAYGLDEAARAASQLGASGIELGDDMKGALRGISGVAAMTNSGYSEISRIFTTVAGQGKMMTMQLRQLENRGLNVAATMAENMGTTEAAVRQMVTDGKIDFQTFATVMNETFGPHATKANETYAGALSNVKAALSRLGAAVQTPHLEQMRKIFNALIPAVDGLFDSVKPFIDLFSHFSEIVADGVIKKIEGLDLKPLIPALEAVVTGFQALGYVLKPIKDAFTDIFPPKTTDQLFDMMVGVRDFVATLQVSDYTMVNIQRTFRGLFAILDMGGMAFKALLRGGQALFNHFKPAGIELMDITGNIGDFIVSIRDSIKETGAFDGAMGKVVDVLIVVADGVKDAVRKIKEGFSDMDVSFAPLTAMGTFISSVFNAIVGVLKKTAPFIGDALSFIGNAIGSIGSKIVDEFKGADIFTVIDLLNTGLLATLVVGLKKFIDSLTTVSTSAGGFVKSITGVLDEVRKSLEAYQSYIRANTLMKIAGAMAILTLALIGLSMIDSDKLLTAITAMTALFVELFASMAIFQKIMDGVGFKEMATMSTGMIGMSIAVLILSKALVSMSDLDWAGVAKGMISVAGLIGMLIITVKTLSKSKDDVIEGTVGLILFSTAIVILTNAVKKLGNLDTDVLVDGLFGVGVLLTQLALFMKVTDLDGMGALKGVGLIGMAIAINILALAVRQFGNLDVNTLIKGLGAMGIVLSQLAVFTAITGDSKKVITTAIGLAILGAAMLIFGKAISNMGNLSMEEIGRGLLTMAGTLTLVAVAMRLMPKSMIITGVGLVVVANALITLSEALSGMGSMSWDGIAKGLVVLGGSLTIIAIAMKFMTTALPGALALIVISGALKVMAGVLQVLGGMSITVLITSLVALAAVFGILGGAAALLTPVIPSLALLGATMLLVGGGVALLGAGLVSIAAGIGALVDVGAHGIDSFVETFKKVTTVIPEIMKQIGLGIIAMAQVVSDGMSVIVKVFLDILVEVSKAIIKAAPDVGKAILVLLEEILKIIVAFVPKLVDAGYTILLSILNGIDSNIEEIVTLGISIILNFLAGILTMLPEIIDTGIKIIISFINGMADGIRENTPAMIDAMENMMGALIDAGKALLQSTGVTSFLDGAKEMIDGLIQGAKDKIEDVKEAISNIAKAAIESLKSFITGFADMGKELISGFAEGISDGVGAVKTAVTDTAKSALEGAKKFLKIKSPSKLFKDSIGAQIPKGMAEGIEKHTPDVTQAASKMGKEAFDINKFFADKQVVEQVKTDDKKIEQTKKTAKKQETIQTKSSKKKVKTVKETNEKIEDLEKKAFDKSKAFIEEEKFYNRMTQKQELDAWLRIQERYKEGTEQRKQADREVYTLRRNLLQQQNSLDEEYYNKEVEINDKLKDEIDSLNQAYEDAVKSRTDSLASAFGLFDEIAELEEDIDGYVLLKNLEDQVDAFDVWQKSISSLAKKGINDGLLKELEDMGPKSVEQIKALDRLSSSALDRYVDLWESKHKMAKKQALIELEGLNKETKVKIEELEKTAETELNDLKAVWIQKSAELSGGVVTEFTKMVPQVEKKVTEMKITTGEEFQEMTDDAVDIVENQPWEGLGANMVLGIVSGVEKNGSVLIDAVVSLAVSALRAAEDALGVQSPSKEFARIGKFSVLGLAKGIGDNLGLVTPAVKKMGGSVLSTLSDTLSNISETLDGDMEIQPTIRPVIDLSDVRKALKDTFGDTQGIDAVYGRRQASKIALLNENRKPKSQQPKQDDQPASVVNQFTVHAVIREEADVVKVSQGLYKLQTRANRGGG